MMHGNPNIKLPVASNISINIGDVFWPPHCRSHYPSKRRKTHFRIVQSRYLCVNYSSWRARSGPVGWGTVLQAGRSRVRFSLVSLEFFIELNFPAALWPSNKKNTRNISWRKRPLVCRADNLTTFVCRLSCSLGT